MIPNTRFRPHSVPKRAREIVRQALDKLRASRAAIVSPSAYRQIKARVEHRFARLEGRQWLSARDTFSSVARRLARGASRDGLFSYACVQACCSVSGSAPAAEESDEYKTSAHNQRAHLRSLGICP
jgi:hypothetical protein